MVHRGLSRVERGRAGGRHGSAERRWPDLDGLIVVLGTIVAAGVVYLLYFLVVYSTVTP
jgi:hypothetical protein